MKTPEDFLKEAIGEIRWNLDGSVTKAQLKYAMEQYAKYYHETEVKKLQQHGVMQAEASAGAEGAAVGNSAVGKGVSVELTEDDIKWLHQKPVDTDWIKGYDRA